LRLSEQAGQAAREDASSLRLQLAAARERLVQSEASLRGPLAEVRVSDDISPCERTSPSHRQQLRLQLVAARALAAQATEAGRGGAAAPGGPRGGRGGG
jgi:hypothetical protein